MRKAETKEKGDIGLTQIIANLQLKGISAALPLSEHLPFDLIAIDNQARLARVSIKYRKLNKYNSLEVPLRTISSNARGYQVKVCDLNEVDAFAIYCPDNQKCYYISAKYLTEYKTTMLIRTEAPNHKYKEGSLRFNWGSDFEDPFKIFAGWQSPAKCAKLEP